MDLPVIDGAIMTTCFISQAVTCMMKSWASWFLMLWKKAWKKMLAQHRKYTESTSPCVIIIIITRLSKPTAGQRPLQLISNYPLNKLF